MQLAPNRLNKTRSSSDIIAKKIIFCTQTRHDTIVRELNCRQMCFGLHKLAGCLHRDIPYVTIVCVVYTQCTGGTVQPAPLHIKLYNPNQGVNLLSDTQT